MSASPSPPAASDSAAPSKTQTDNAERVAPDWLTARPDDDSIFNASEPAPGNSDSPNDDDDGDDSAEEGPSSDEPLYAQSYAEGLECLDSCEYDDAIEAFSFALENLSDALREKGEELMDSDMAADYHVRYGQALLGKFREKNELLQDDNSKLQPASSSSGEAGIKISSSSSSSSSTSASSTGASSAFEGPSGPKMTLLASNRRLDAPDADDADKEEDESDDEDGVAEKDNAGKDDAEKDEESENIPENELAWEVFEVARLSYERMYQRCPEKYSSKYADVFMHEGDLTMEMDATDPKAISLYEECVQIREKHKKPGDRFLSEAYFKLGAAYSWNEEKLEPACSTFGKARTLLHEAVDLIEKSGDIDDKKSQEIDDLTQIIKDVDERILGIQEEMRVRKMQAALALQRANMLQQFTASALGGTAAAASGGPLSSSSSASSSSSGASNSSGSSSVASFSFSTPSATTSKPSDGGVVSTVQPSSSFLQSWGTTTSLPMGSSSGSSSSGFSFQFSSSSSTLSGEKSTDTPASASSVASTSVLSSAAPSGGPVNTLVARKGPKRSSTSGSEGASGDSISSNPEDVNGDVTAAKKPRVESSD